MEHYYKIISDITYLSELTLHLFLYKNKCRVNSRINLLSAYGGS
jgi:hypothetical protein